MDLAGGMTVRIKRIYEEPADDDGYRVFIDRLWPRGLKKQQVRFDLWLKDVAPSTELRRWYGHDPAKWEEFKSRYSRELDEQSEAVARLVAIAEEPTSTPGGAGANLTLVFSARAERYSNAAALKEYLETRIFR